TGWDAGTANNLYDGGTIAMKVVIPDRLTMGLAPGDGWNITLRLKNTNEPNTPPYWTDFVVKLRMPDTSDPLIESVSFRGPSSESSQTSIQVVVVNAGNADMPIGTQLSLSCSGAYARITDNTGFVTVPALTHNDTFYANWSVTTDPIPWYTDSETFKCSATLVLPSSVFGNNETNDALDVTLQIESWTPPSTTLSISGITLPFSPVFVLGLLLLIGALSLLQRGHEEQSNRLHLSAYVAAAALGIMSLSNPASWFPALAALTSIFFAGVVAWISSSELQTIHDDRKKSRIGTRAVLEDHDKEQANTRKELRAIISCAPYAFLPFVLITPSLSIDLGAGSLGALLLYLIVSPILVHLILWFLDKSYDRLYGELADIELRAIKIKKILGTVGKSSDSDQSEAQSSSGGE
ncbi:MAG: hypothetical protein VX502_04250, partial [Candidatus Thermoplasmatota archaeon]|nr:hypothetical protein [Candidatus Thermoplasmatota archaeon]